MTDPLTITATIHDRRVARDAVLAWELGRARKVARILDVDPAADVATLRDRLVDRKLILGHAGIEQLLARKLPAADLSGRAGAALPRGRRVACTITLTSPSGFAEALPGWYAETITANDEAPLLAACPDHYLSRTNADGTQEVIETTGGSPLPVRMRFDDTDTATIRTPADRAFPTQWVSTARASNDAAIGGVRHQFRDRPGGGFDARLTVEFPLTTPPHMITAHRWHLACEFSNWLQTINT
jgi:hypothetical protein